MSLRDLKRKSESALEVLPANPGTGAPRRPITAPGATAMMQPTIDALNDRAKAAEKRAVELEARVKDLESLAIPVAAIEPNPWQPRRLFDEAEILKLAGSIAEVGLIQPVIVRRCVGTSNTRYQIVAGERRWRAHKALGKLDIKSVVIAATDGEMAALALAENFDREDLTAYEIALAIKNAEAAFPNRKSLALALGINRSDLYDFLAFFALPPFVLSDLDERPGTLGRTAAKELSVVIKRHGELAIEALQRVWPRLKSSDLDQGKIAATIEAAILRGGAPKTDRDIRKLFVGKEQAGSITRDASHLAIKIKVAALTPEKEVELRAFVERILG